MLGVWRRGACPAVARRQGSVPVRILTGSEPGRLTPRGTGSDVPRLPAPLPNCKKDQGVAFLGWLTSASVAPPLRKGISADTGIEKT